MENNKGESQRNIVGRKAALPFALVALLFLLWGVANNMNDTLLAAFRRIMSMSDAQTSLVQSAFYGAYFCFALPAAMFIRRFSYKAGILLGLGLYAAGTLLFAPAGDAASYPFFLCAIYVMAGGCAVLETTANPYIMMMGDRSTATRRLNIAQTLMPVGALTGILVSRHFILGELNAAGEAERALMSAQTLRAVQQEELNAISSTYACIGVVLIVLLVVIAVVKMPARGDDDGSLTFGSTMRRLMRNAAYCRGVAAEFFYVGMQTCVWSFTIRYAMNHLDLLEKEASLIFLYSMISFSAFRFIFTWAMKYIRPARLLLWASIASVALCVGAMVLPGVAGVASLVGISAAMSLMFPTIYGIALGSVEPTDAKLGASVLVMAILGGAVITPLQGVVSDAAGIAVSMVVPLVCAAAVLAYAASNLRSE